jgi:hypothetical protein
LPVTGAGDGDAPALGAAGAVGTLPTGAPSSYTLITRCSTRVTMVVAGTVVAIGTVVPTVIGHPSPLLSAI